MVQGRPIRPSRTNTQKSCPFHYWGLECQSRKSIKTWSNRQILLCSTEWRRAMANNVLPRKHTGHSKHPLPTTQEKTLHMDITRWTIPKLDWYILCSQRWKSPIPWAKTRWSIDCSSDHELLIAKYRLELKKIEKTTTPFMYGLNNIPYHYRVKVKNRFKWLNLIDRVPEELWMQFCDCTGGRDQDHFQEKRNAKRQNGCLRRPYK